MKKQTKSKIPRSEAALKRAIKKMEYDPYLAIRKPPVATYYGIYVYYFEESIPDDSIWVGKLSDFWRKRKPVRGVKKTMRKLLRGKK